jgi:hypothetical protein
MESWQALVCYGFGSIRRSIYVRFWLVLLFLVCVGQVCRIHANLPASKGYIKEVKEFWEGLGVRLTDFAEFTLWPQRAGRWR